MSNAHHTPESSTGREGFRPLDFSAFPHEVVVDDAITINTFLPEDAPRLDEITAGDDVRAYIPWAAENKADYIERTTRDRDARGPRYAVRVNGELAGHFTIFPSPDVLGVIEMGYVLAEEFRGRGIVARTLPVGERLVAELMPGMKVGLCIDDSNEPSKKAARRLGYVPTEIVSDGDRLYLKQGEHEQASAS